MAREERSHVRKRRRGCLGGCLTKILLLLGLCAVLFVGACVLGIVKSDPETGAPALSLDGVGIGGVSMDALKGLQLPEIGGLAGGSGLSMPGWAYSVKPEGLTVKALKAGKGEAIFVCADGYTLLVGGGSGMGISLAGQLLLSGVNRLHAAVALQSSDEQIGGMEAAVRLMKPGYLLYPDTQVKSGSYNAMLTAAQETEGVQLIAPQQGLTFSLGRATVTVIGPAARHHTDERDDGLSVRIDYGGTSVLVMGSVTSAGEREILASANVRADVLIASCGGGLDGTCAEFVQAVAPQIALLTGSDPANAVRVRLERAGAQVYTAKEYGVMTVFSDGENVVVQP